MSLFTLTINAPTASFGEHLRSETAEIRFIVETAMQQLGSGAAQSGNCIARSGNNVGTWTYTPVATS